MNDIPHDLFAANFLNAITHIITSVQPMNIGDPTRGGENIFSIRFWSLHYENKQMMMWEDDGGCIYE